MEKNLIIGAFTGYNYAQLKPWVESIDESGFVGDKVVIVFETDQETVDKLVSKNFNVILANPDSLKQIPIHVARFFFIYDYLRENWEKYKFVITTDMKDVYFQKNPVEWLENKINAESGYKIVAGSESLKYKDEPWGNENLMQTYGQHIYEQFKECEIYNVGTLGGQSEYIKDLCFNIFLLAINRPIPIVDQAVFNVLIQTQPFKDITYFAKQKDGWACQAGTTVDPSKIEYFRSNLLEKEPIWENNKVKTSLGEEFYIVHQYDRVPDWKQFITEKYKQNDNSKFFIYNN